MLVNIMLNPKHLEAIPRMFGITQGELAERCGVTQGHINNVIRGRAMLSFEVNRAIIQVFEIDSDVLGVLNAMITLKNQYHEKLNDKGVI